VGPVEKQPLDLRGSKGRFPPGVRSSTLHEIVGSKRNIQHISPSRLASPKSLESLVKSPYLSKMNGYVAYNRHFVTANVRVLQKILSQRELYDDGETSFIMTKPEIAFGHRYTSFMPLRGTLESNLYKAANLAHSYSPIWLGFYLPYHRYLLSLAQKHRFRRDSWGNHCIVFEKRI
jgi:hypothetical protein